MNEDELKKYIDDNKPNNNLTIGKIDNYLYALFLYNNLNKQPKKK
jgi:hypothetical protein